MGAACAKACKTEKACALEELKVISCDWRLRMERAEAGEQARADGAESCQLYYRV